MEALPNLIGEWGHGLAAILFAALALRTVRERDGGPERLLLLFALAITSSWATYVAIAGFSAPLLGVFQSLRNGTWLLFMFGMLHRGERSSAGHPAAITAIYGVLCGLLIAQAGVDALAAQLDPATDVGATVRDTTFLLRMIVAAGSLLLVHHLFTSCAPEAQTRIGLVMAALAAMWTYDLNLYAISYIRGERAIELLCARGLAVAMLAPIMALGIRAGGSRRVRFSHTATFRSLSIIAVMAYLVAGALVIGLVDWIAGPHARMAETVALFALAAGALFLVPSPRVKAWMKLQVAKHFLQHRYDYRIEWMRFTETVGQPAGDAGALSQRVVKAMADITESPGGLLFLREGDTLTAHAEWNWPGGSLGAAALNRHETAALHAHGSVVDLDSVRLGLLALPLPDWLRDDRNSWALVPLLHFGGTIGAIVLTRPAIDRSIDWEDIDMLGAAGRQVASYVREAQGQSALAEAQRFEEFNRRFAFIMHDIKNLVSQLSLLARNAERHAESPEFRADMIATLHESVDRMNEMLARLSQHHRGRTEEPRAMALRPLAERVARAKGQGHRVEVRGDAPLAIADPARAEQVLAHLVQNAIEATADGAPVLIRLGEARGCAIVDVVDRGVGMTAEFIRRDLFKPFASSKDGGFGIGAFEARTHMRAMGGEIEVLSRPGEGSCFTLLFPRAETGAPGKSKERAA